MISTIITAGGVSRRFGTNKLLEIYEDKAVIEHTISKFYELSDEIIIPSTNQTREFIESSPVFNEKITFAPFGATRQKSVFNALTKCKYHDFVLIHDGARPFILQSDIKNIIDEVKIKKALCAGVFATDTIKITDADKNIVKTIDRSNVFLAQTPQAFSYALIYEAHKKFEQRDDFTDDCSLVEALGQCVGTYVCQGLNKKITTRADL